MRCLAPVVFDTPEQQEQFLTSFFGMLALELDVEGGDGMSSPQLPPDIVIRALESAGFDFAVGDCVGSCQGGSRGSGFMYCAKCDSGARRQGGAATPMFVCSPGLSQSACHLAAACAGVVGGRCMVDGVETPCPSCSTPTPTPVPSDGSSGKIGLLGLLGLLAIPVAICCFFGVMLLLSSLRSSSGPKVLPREAMVIAVGSMDQDSGIGYATNVNAYPAAGWGNNKNEMHESYLPYA